MAIRNIMKNGDPVLRKKSRDVTTFDQRLHQLLDDMADTMRASNGLGLAAVQVGVLRRAVIVDVGGDLIELINPVVVEQSEETQVDPEGCLSFPGQFGMVKRPMKVVVEAQDRVGILVIHTAEGLKARAFCHEIDHTHGLLFIDLASEMLDDDAEEDEDK